MEWIIAATLAVFALVVLAQIAMNMAAPVFQAECHERGGWALMNSAGTFEGCLHPPPSKRVAAE